VGWRRHDCQAAPFTWSLVPENQMCQVDVLHLADPLISFCNQQMRVESERVSAVRSGHFLGTGILFRDQKIPEHQNTRHVPSCKPAPWRYMERTFLIPPEKYLVWLILKHFFTGGVLWPTGRHGGVSANPGLRNGGCSKSVLEIPFL
jgi:hypothetical protein